MTTKIFTASLLAALLTSTAAVAQESRRDAADAPARTRADVVAELEAARRAGELESRSHSYGLHARHDIKSTKTRDEVRAELAAARAAAARQSRGE